MANDKVWSPLNWKDASFVDTAAKVQVGDAVRNPVADLPKRATMKQRDRAYRVADRLDRELAARGLRIDHTATIIGFVERVGGRRRSNPSDNTPLRKLLPGTWLAGVYGSIYDYVGASKLRSFKYDPETGDEAKVTDRKGNTYTIRLSPSPQTQGIADRVEGIAIRSQVFLPNGKLYWRSTFVVDPKGYDRKGDLVHATAHALLRAMKAYGGAPRRSNPSLTTSYAFDPSTITLDLEPSDRDRGLTTLRDVVDRLWGYRELSGSGELSKVSEYEDPDQTYFALQYIRPLSRVEASMVDDPIAYLNDARGSKSASANRLLDLARRLLVTEPALSYSDYSQASYVEANVDTVIEMVDEGELHEGTVVETSGGYGSRGVLLRIWREEDYDSVAEIIDKLASYPVLDETRAGEREFEKTVEAIEDFAVSEFSDMLRSELEDLVDRNIEARPKDENAIVAAADKYERIIDDAPLAEWLMNNNITDYAYEESEGVYVDLQRWLYNYPGTMQDILEEIVKTYG